MTSSSNSTISVHTNSYYAASAVGMRDYPSLARSESCDVCVIGGGYTGLSTALNLSERGFDSVVLEANKVGWGASGRNGGQLGSGLNWSQKELESEFGNDRASQFWDLCEQAKQEVIHRIERHRIDCDFKRGVLAAAVTQKAAKAYREQVDHLRKNYSFDSIRYIESTDIQEMLGTDKYLAGMLDTSSGHLHPLNLAIGLANASVDANARIYENSAMSGYKKTKNGYVVTTEEGEEVHAKYIVFACNAYIDRASPTISRFIMPFTSYIIATESLSENVAHRINRDDVAVFDSRFCLNYYRLSSDRRLIFGGAEKYLPTDPGDIKSMVRPRVLYLYPELRDTKIDYAWGGRIAVTMNRLPSIGCIDGNVYYAQGFSGHGVALTNIVGKFLAQAITGSAEGFDVFASIPHKGFTGGRYLRWPIHILTMLYFSMRDKLDVRFGGNR